VRTGWGREGSSFRYSRWDRQLSSSIGGVVLGEFFWYRSFAGLDRVRQTVTVGAFAEVSHGWG